MSEPTDPTDQRSGREGMGVSSERVGPTGPGQVGRTGLRDTSRDRPGTAPEPRPEQSAGGVEVNPDPISLPKAGYPKQHPRSKERPFYRRGS